MKNVYKLEFHAGSKEELLPDFESEFPYIASNAELDKYVGRSAPWHWHKAIELFYMESGTLEYYTPKKKLSFSAGSGGFINSNVLHMTKAVSRTEKIYSGCIFLIRLSFLETMGVKLRKSMLCQLLQIPRLKYMLFTPIILYMQIY